MMCVVENKAHKRRAENSEAGALCDGAHGAPLPLLGDGRGNKKPSKNNLHHLSHSFRSIFIFSSVVYVQYTPSSKRNLYSKIIDKSEAVYFFHVSKTYGRGDLWQ